MSKITTTIRQLRSEFKAGKLDEKSISKNPFIQFEKWFADAVNANVLEPNAMTVASVSKDGMPDARIVLLRDFSKAGFSFYTNYRSAKGKEMIGRKKACLNFFWPELQRQVRIKGRVEKLSATVSDKYFASRPRESQIGAWASFQSEELESRTLLESRFEKLINKYEGKKIPRPAHWGGFLVKPVEIEFWQGRESRLHDRIVFRKKRNEWQLVRLNP